MTKNNKDVVTNTEYEYSRILSAAVVNARFRQALLKDPGQAIAGGYRGEKFSLGSEERSKLAAIRASNLADFANQMSQVQNYGRVSSVGAAD